MSKTLGIHIFRRDLRLSDNTALIKLSQQVDTVLPLFILDPIQTESNEYFGSNSFCFMLESLIDLDQQISNKGGSLAVLRGKPVDILQELILRYNIDYLSFNKDYTPFSIDRDIKIRNFCTTNNIKQITEDDTLINPPSTILKDDGTPYTVYTPFKNRSLKTPVSPPAKIFSIRFLDDVDILAVDLKALYQKAQKGATNTLKGGRSEALELIEKMETLDNYDELRNFPEKNHTSLLSAHLKFGTVSVREVYAKAISLWGHGATFINELYWRDFFTHILFHFPYVLSRSFKKKFNNIPWDNNKDHFKSWKNGKTGFPIVDAGMRELLQTGSMHNRVRMIVASFLVKDLRIDWKWGEKHFAKHLTDYDPAVNNGNWQWAASTGCDAQPWFRIFNPWLQQKKFDKDCVYIKRWIPELFSLSPNEIHNWQNMHATSCNYPSPIIDHKTEANKTKNLFSELNQ